MTDVRSWAADRSERTLDGFGAVSRCYLHPECRIEEAGAVSFRGALLQMLRGFVRPTPE